MLINKIISLTESPKKGLKNGRYLSVPQDFPDLVLQAKEQEITDQFSLLITHLKEQEPILKSLGILVVLRFSGLKFRSFCTAEQKILLRSDVDIAFVCTQELTKEQAPLINTLKKQLKQDIFLMLDMTFIAQSELKLEQLEDLAFVIRRNLDHQDNVLWQQQAIKFTNLGTLKDPLKLNSLNFMSICALQQICKLVTNSAPLTILDEDVIYKFPISLSKVYMKQNNLSTLPSTIKESQQSGLPTEIIMPFAEFINRRSGDHVFTQKQGWSLQTIEADFASLSPVHLAVFREVFAAQINSWPDFIKYQLTSPQFPVSPALKTLLSAIWAETDEQYSQRLALESSVGRQIFCGIADWRERRSLFSIISPFFLYFNELHQLKPYEEIVRYVLAIPKEIIQMPDGLTKKQTLFCGLKQAIPMLYHDIQIKPIQIEAQNRGARLDDSLAIIKPTKKVPSSCCE